MSRLRRVFVCLRRCGSVLLIECVAKPYAAEGLNQQPLRACSLCAVSGVPETGGCQGWQPRAPRDGVTACLRHATHGAKGSHGQLNPPALRFSLPVPRHFPRMAAPNLSSTPCQTILGGWL